MLFAHDTELNLLCAVALANSGQGDAYGSGDSLTSLEELDAFFRRWGFSRWSHRRRADLDAIRALRPELRELLLSSRDDAVGIVNRWLAQTSALPRLVRHDDLDWHIHAIADDALLADRIRSETAMAMVDMIRADEMGRLSVCTDERCSGIVLDLSRNRSKLFCSTACSNRHAVAAYRARQRGTDA
ncbi:MAG: CGNR zinc finger domain-containing protein [Nocardioides sp.]|jgi:predicted RNA-binding Zn ribbon-like protein